MASQQRPEAGGEIEKETVREDERVPKKKWNPTDDPRLDPRIRKMFQQVPETKAEMPKTRSEAVALCAKGELAWLAMQNAFSSLYGRSSGPLYHKVQSRTEKIKGIDGNEIEVDVYSPIADGGAEDDAKAKIAHNPTVVWIHGGGMANGSPRYPQFIAAGRELALRGIRVLLPSFRLSKSHPYPAGLHDCYSVLKWARDTFGGPVHLAGESGGANLAIAAVLFARKRGDDIRTLVRGCYLQCPFIAGGYPNTGRYPSQAEFDGYLFGAAELAAFAMAYTVEGKAEDARSSLAWPSKTIAEDLKGFPTSIVRVDECDPLRDEGCEFYRSLLDAGVSARLHITGGATHSAFMYPGMDDMAAEAFDELKAFVLRTTPPRP